MSWLFLALSQCFSTTVELTPCMCMGMPWSKNGNWLHVGNQFIPAATAHLLLLVCIFMPHYPWLWWWLWGKSWVFWIYFGFPSWLLQCPFFLVFCNHAPHMIDFYLFCFWWNHSTWERISWLLLFFKKCFDFLLLFLLLFLLHFVQNEQGNMYLNESVAQYRET